MNTVVAVSGINIAALTIANASLIIDKLSHPQSE